MYTFIFISIEGREFWFGLPFAWAPLVMLEMALCRAVKFYPFYKFRGYRYVTVQTSLHHCVGYHNPNTEFFRSGILYNIL
jgi:hypothetical protein